MKTRYLLIIGIIAVIVILVVGFTFLTYFQYTHYKTVGNNEMWYYHPDGYDVECEVRLYQNPGECNAIDENGNIVDTKTTLGNWMSDKWIGDPNFCKYQGGFWNSTTRGCYGLYEMCEKDGGIPKFLKKSKPFPDIEENKPLEYLMDCYYENGNDEFYIITDTDLDEPLDIASIEDGYIILNPVDTCAWIDINRLTLDELNQRYPATYTTKSGKIYEIKFLSINDDDLKEMPVLSELIRATHHIPFPLNGGISASKGLVENPDWNDYFDWYDQKKTEQFNLDEVRVSGFVYNEEYYSIGFSIC